MNSDLNTNKTSLAKLIQAHPDHKLPTATALDYARQISQSLIELHQNRVIMLDLKPANVLIDEHQEAFLADFGISKIREVITGGEMRGFV